MGGFHSREDGVFVSLSLFYGVTDFWSLLIVISKLMGPAILGVNGIFQYTVGALVCFTCC